MGGAVENLVDGVERRGANVAQDHANRADGQRRLAAARGVIDIFGSVAALSIEFYHYSRIQAIQ